MVQMTPGEFPKLPVERVARLLLQSGREDPALLGRSRAVNDKRVGPTVEPTNVLRQLTDQQKSTDQQSPPITNPLPSMLRPSIPALANPEVDANQYLEDLVSIAVTSAHQVEDISRQAQQTTKTARRGMVACGVFGAFGLFVGVAGIVDNHFGGTSDSSKLSEVTGEVRALGDMQRETNEKLAAIRTDVITRHNAPPDVQQAGSPGSSVAPVYQAPLPTPPVQPAAVYPAPPVNYAPTAYSPPWHDYRPPAPRVATSSSPPGVSRFIASMRQNIRAIFR